MIEPPPRLVTVLDGAERGIRAFALTVAWLMLLVMIGTRTFDVIARNFMVTPSSLLTLFENRAFMFLVLSGLSYAYLANAHVRVDVLRERFGPRVQAWIEIVGGLVALLPLCAVVAALYLPFITDAYAAGDRSWLFFGRPLAWLVKSAMPAAFALLALAGLIVIARNVLFLRGRLPAPHP